MELLKTLYYTYKIRSYEKLIIGVTKSREKLKAKQAEFTARQEHYRKKLKETTEV